MLILAADDDPTSLLIAVTTLRNLGHRCITATDGIQAWKIFQTRRPEVVLCDWMMPGMTGLELCRKIRAQTARYTYVMMVTAYSSHEDICEGMNAGADDYLVKPLNAAQVEIRLIVAARVTSLHRQLAQQRTKLATVARREAVLRRA
jgi:two-component system chemotaxis response regulator CheY